MNLQEVLARNKDKAQKAQYKIKPVSIATDDRPYDYIKKAPSSSIVNQNNKTHQKNISNTNTQKRLTNQQAYIITSDKVETNWAQTNDKLMTNWRQTTYLTDDTGNKVETNWGQTTPKTSDITNDKLETDWSQINNKTTFSSLTGLQRYIAFSIYILCKASRDKKTKEISIAQLSYCCKSSIKSVKKSIFRLIEKGIISRDSFKNGRGGWTVYYLPNDIYHEIMNMETEDKVMTNWRQSDDKLIPKLATFASSSSGKEYLNTTTTEDNKTQARNYLSPEWQGINIEPLSTINFTKTHLIQIASQNILTPEIVQDSIYTFAFDLQENNKAKNIKGDPISFFMGILRNGKLYTPPSNYESPKDKALRLYNERMLKTERGRVEAEKQAISLAFNDWFSHLTDEQKVEFLPEMLRRNVTSEKLAKNKILEGSAKSHFEAEVWPDLKNKIISGAEINTETKPAGQGEKVS